MPLPPLDPTDLDAVETARRMSLANWVTLNEGLEGPWISRPSTIAGVPVVTFAVDEQALSAEQVMVHLHGGAFVLGSPTASAALAVGVAQRTGVPVVSVDYRLAPEHRCPAGLTDIVNVCLDVLASRRLAAVYGESAGANLSLAAAVALRIEARRCRAGSACCRRGSISLARATPTGRWRRLIPSWEPSIRPRSRPSMPDRTRPARRPPRCSPTWSDSRPR